MPTQRKPPRAAPSKPKKRGASMEDASKALVLQGGGALGAYQGGVYEALLESDGKLDWVAGVSIGAVNAALIAGNAPEKRVAKLREFWELVSSGPGQSLPVGWGDRTAASQWSAASATDHGHPRVVPASHGWDAAAGRRRPRAELLRHLAVARDAGAPDRLRPLNGGGCACPSAQSTCARGNFAYFDAPARWTRATSWPAAPCRPASRRSRSTAKEYWDGGTVSNTPLQYVLDQPAPPRHRRVPGRLVPRARGLARARWPMCDRAREGHPLLEPHPDEHPDRLPTAGESPQAARRACSRSCRRSCATTRRAQHWRLRCAHRRVDVVHLIYRSKHYESQSKDYEFSRLSMQEHWESGRADMRATVAHPEWTGSSATENGVTTLRPGRHRRAGARAAPGGAEGPTQMTHASRSSPMKLKDKVAIITGARQRHRQGDRPRLRARGRQGRHRRPQPGRPPTRPPRRSAAAGGRRSAWRWT